MQASSKAPRAVVARPLFPERVGKAGLEKQDGKADGKAGKSREKQDREKQEKQDGKAGKSRGKAGQKSRTDGSDPKANSPVRNFRTTVDAPDPFHAASGRNVKST
jgi:hypothetical protein